jgi:acyl-CoA dehydrogenase family protein 10
LSTAAASQPATGKPAAGAVRKGMEINIERVAPLLLNNGTLTRAQVEAGCTVEQFSHGQSNPTYKLAFGSRQLVLRKQPPGKLLRGAHAVDREEKVMSALSHPESTVPVPRTRLYCEDPKVIGTPFIVQDFADGRLFRDAAMADVATAKERGELYGAFLKACAAIHTVDYEKVGLGDFGKVGGYIGRQTKVWTSQYRAAETETISSMERLMEWLPQALPAGDDMTRLVHGDLRVDNMIFAKDKAEVIAVLDWELSTLGHPAADVALASLAYVAPPQLPPQFSFGVSDPRDIGIPSEQDFVDAYVDVTGYTSVRTHLDYYRAFVCFRMASILQGVYKRALSGQASAPDAEKVGKMASVFADLGNDAAAQYTTVPGRLDRTAGAGAAFSAVARAGGAPGKIERLRSSVRSFIGTKLLPIEQELFNRSYDAPERWTTAPQLEALKAEARRAGLWNLFLPDESGLTNREYATLAEEMGRCLWAPELFNCNAPDTGNMEVLHMFGTPAQKERWLEPLLAGEMRSCFAMTEPDVASSDATNMQASA